MSRAFRQARAVVERTPERKLVKVTLAETSDWRAMWGDSPIKLADWKSVDL